MTGSAVPLNRFQIRDIITALGKQLSDTYRELYVYADLEFQERDGGEVYDDEGNLHTIEPNLEHQSKYAAVEAKVMEEADEIKRVMSRYVELLPLEQRVDYIKKYKLERFLALPE